jgi:hypothetical protein
MNICSPPAGLEGLSLCLGQMVWELGTQ